MKKIILVALLAITSQVSFAGIYTDDLSRCLVESSTEQDKLDLVKWMFGAMSLHPAVKDLATVQESDSK